MKKSYKLILATVFTISSIAVFSNKANAQGNLFINGDFSMGNTGFSCAQAYSPYYSPCNYYVNSTFFTLSDPTLIDHTPTADGMFMSIDGCSPATIIWEQTIPVIQTNCNFDFSFWATRADYIVPIFEVHFIGNVTGDNIVGTLTDSLYTGAWTWEQYFIPTWNSGANTSVTVQLINLESDPVGNDFALDDFLFHGDCGSAVNSVTDIDNSSFNLSVMPNPASESATVSYVLDQDVKVSATLFSVDGKLIANLFSEDQTKGKHEQKLVFDSSLAKGIYLLYLNVDGINGCQKLIIE